MERSSIQSNSKSEEAIWQARSKSWVISSLMTAKRKGQAGAAVCGSAIWASEATPPSSGDTRAPIPARLKRERAWRRVYCILGLTAGRHILHFVVRAVGARMRGGQKGP